MSPPTRQSMYRTSEELGIHVITLWNYGKDFRQQEQVVAASDNDSECCSSADNFVLVLGERRGG